MITYCEWIYRLEEADRKRWGDEAVDLHRAALTGSTVLPGFVVSKEAYVEFFSAHELRAHIEGSCADLDLKKPQGIHAIAEDIRRAILAAPLSRSFSARLAAYAQHLEAQLVRSKGAGVRLTVRAGSLEVSGLVRKATDLEKLVKSIYALTFHDRALYRRLDEKNAILHEPIALFVAHAEKPDYSGIAYAHDPSTHDDLTVVIEASHLRRSEDGLDIQDIYRVDRKSLALLSRDVRKQWWAEDGSGSHVSPTHLGKPVQTLTDEQAIQLARQVKMAQSAFSETMSFSWEYSHRQFWITQVDPYEAPLDEKKEDEGLKPILVGKSGSLGRAYGPARIIRTKQDRAKLKDGDIAVLESAHLNDCAWLAGAAGLITEAGTEATSEGRLAHQMGIPAVVGVSQALTHLKNGQMVTLNGMLGTVYSGVALAAHAAGTAADGLPATGVKIMATVTDPHLIKKENLVDSDGIGLLRGEFILSMLGIHPEEVISRKIEREYIEVLAENLELAVRAVSPRPVIYQLHDMNSANLIGIRPHNHSRHEPNPTLGYRGSHRLLDQPEVLDLELKALSRLISKDLAYLSVMMPMARSVDEVKKMLTLLKASPLGQETNIRLWVKCETPALAILAEELCALDIAGVCFDVPSIAQLITGFDKENRQVAHHVDQADPAVEQALTYAIATCREHGVSTLLSAELDDLRPEVVQAAIEAGLTGLTVAPAMVRTMHGLVGSIEKSLILKSLVPSV